MADGRSGTRHKDGPALLAKYLDDEDLSYAGFGEKIGCTKAHVCGLVRRKSNPSLALSQVIARITENRVPMTSWATAQTRPRAA